VVQSGRWRQPAPALTRSSGGWLLGGGAPAASRTAVKDLGRNRAGPIGEEDMTKRNASGARIPTNPKPAGLGRLSRRRFVKLAASGTLGATLLHTLPAPALASNKEVGTITLDAVMLSYIAAVPGSGGSSTFNPLKGYSTIFNLSIPGVALSASPGASATGLFFYQQTASQKVPGALDLMPAPHIDITNTITGGPPQSSALYGLLAPRFKLKGTPEELNFHLLGPIQAFLVQIADLLSDPGMVGVSQDTAQSMSAQYVSSVPDLIAPRYEQGQLFEAGAGSNTMIFSSSDFESGTAQASVTATITAQTGFTSATVKDALAVGKNITITYNSGFDKESKKALSLEISAGDTIFTSYLDNVFKSVVLV